VWRATVVAEVIARLAVSLILRYCQPRPATTGLSGCSTISTSQFPRGRWLRAGHIDPAGQAGGAALRPGVYLPGIRQAKLSWSYYPVLLK
jgi:hypothetical protein